MTRTLRLTPRGHLQFAEEAEAPPLPENLDGRLGEAFDRGNGFGLVALGAGEATTALPPALAFWRDFASRYVTALTAIPEGSEIAVAAPEKELLGTLCLDAPPMTGGEYLSPEILENLWSEIEAAVKAELEASGRSLQAFLKSKHPGWNLVGRVHFNLAENRKDPDAPFAFLATYTSRLSSHGKAQHLPLSQALSEFSGGKKNARLLSLLLPVQKAAESCEWLAGMVDSGEIYHPLRWQVPEAVRFLKDVPRLEASGIVVRMPRTWSSDRPPRPRVTATVGQKNPSVLGMDALLDFHMEVTLDGTPLTPEEIRSLLASGEGLQWVRGQWVEMDPSRLETLIARFEGVERSLNGEGLPFGQAVRLLSGAPLDGSVPADPDWSEVVAGKWLSDLLANLRSPESLASADPGPALKATLRPYQKAGVRWLNLLVRMGLGACLADDMGLGKTIQVLALLLTLERPRPSLLVAPASLLANWQQEARRFAPSLRLLVAHPSVLSPEELRGLSAGRLSEVDLVVTSYGTLMRLPHLAEIPWHLVVADEAQALKNPGAKQTKTVKSLSAHARIALTGTPVENRLSDLWSLFDFTHPGLLGSQRAFADFTKERTHYGPLRTLVKPYILRRLKSDRSIISDLPDKTEVMAWCSLNSAQAVLYQKAVGELESALGETEGIERKGLVLAFLMRFKQICNHPSQWLGDGSWKPEESGKFSRLGEIAETVAAKQEKMLVFTQFKETTAPLAAFLGSVFGREGLILHGGTPVGKRRELVRRFQEDEDAPFFVLSIKAGGTGLNLTAASHVVHFDRWWNPAVENQATDRAWRIGQHRNVLVHKFICRGTVEERIDELIRSKTELVRDVLEGGTEINLTELGDDELLDLVRLDIHSIGE
ncbi:MAG: DEAD/DEAH box helicase [Nitrospirae bacterium]|nr:DEAD/DEAH box helicase [Nitrospirota bacterium]